MKGAEACEESRMSVWIPKEVKAGPAGPRAGIPAPAWQGARGRVSGASSLYPCGS